jgi:hypothetical protein
MISRINDACVQLITTKGNVMQPSMSHESASYPNIEKHKVTELSAMNLVTRAQAIASGRRKYFTNKPCHVGHIVPRYVSNKQCCMCNAVKSKEREKEICTNDPSRRMYRSVQRRSGQCLTGRSSPRKALGCDHHTLRSYVAQKFTEGMSWDKYGQWELDHIVPLSSATSLDELIQLCHYENLQPLWKRQNRIKGGR